MKADAIHIKVSLNSSRIFGCETVFFEWLQIYPQYLGGRLISASLAELSCHAVVFNNFFEYGIQPFLDSRTWEFDFTRVFFFRMWHWLRSSFDFRCFSLRCLILLSFIIFLDSCKITSFFKFFRKVIWQHDTLFYRWVSFRRPIRLQWTSVLSRMKDW